MYKPILTTLSLAFIACVNPSYSDTKPNKIPMLIPVIKHYESPAHLFQVSILCIYQYETLKEANPRVTQAYCDYWKSIVLQTMNHITHDIDIKATPFDYYEKIQK